MTTTSAATTQCTIRVVGSSRTTVARGPAAGGAAGRRGGGPGGRAGRGGGPPGRGVWGPAFPRPPPAMGVVAVAPPVPAGAGEVVDALDALEPLARLVAVHRRHVEPGRPAVLAR